MVEIVEQTSIARPAAEVWAALADFGAISRWAPNVDHSCLMAEQRDGVGAVRRVQVGRNALLERIVVWEPGERLAYEIEGLPPVIRSVTNTWHLAGSDSSTSVALTSTVDAGPRPPQKLIARVVGRGLGSASRQMLSGFKRHLEEAAP
mgnify:FL=1